MLVELAIGDAYGAGFEYSTLGYTVLGAAIEGAMGQNFRQVIQEQVFDEIGMPQTFPDDPDATTLSLEMATE